MSNDVTQNDQDAPVIPPFSFRTLSRVEFEEWLREGLPALVNGKWKNKTGGTPPLVAVYEVEWNGGKAFVMPGPVLASVNLVDLADEDGVIRGTEEQPPEAPAADPGAAPAEAPLTAPAQEASDDAEILSDSRDGEDQGSVERDPGAAPAEKE